MDVKITVTLDLDSVIGTKAESTTTNEDACEATSSTFHVQQVAPETPVAFVSKRSTYVLAESSESLSLSPLQALSFEGDTESLFEGEWSSFLNIEVELTRAELAPSKPSLPSVLCPSKSRLNAKIHGGFFA